MTDVKKGWHERALELFKRHIKGVYVTISVVLVLLIISLLSINTSYTSSKISTITDFSKMEAPGYSISTDSNGCAVYSPIEGERFMLLFKVNGIKDINSITLTLKEPISAGGVSYFYCATASQDVFKMGPVASYTSSDCKSVSLYMNFSDFDTVGIAVPETFTPDSLILESISFTGLNYGINPIAIILLAIILLFLAVFEKKFGYFSWLASLFVRLYSTTMELAKQKRIARLIVRALLILSIATLSVLALVCLMLARLTTGMILCFFILPFLVLGLFITDRILANSINASRMLLVSILLCGFALIFLLRPITANSWDEEFHYARSVDVRCILFGVERTSADVWQTARNFSVSSSEYTYESYLNDSSGVIESLIYLDSLEVKSYFSWVNPYKCIGFIPPALAMIIGDAFNTNYFAMVLLSKLAGLLTFAFVIYAGVKRLKSGVYLFSSVALLPVSIFIASSFSYDYFVTAFLMYSFAYFISELQSPEKKFTIRDAVFMLGALVIGCGPKAIYFVLGIPMLFMSKDKFESKRAHKHYIFACLGAMLIILLTFILPFFINIETSGDLRGGSDVSAFGQVKFILENPLKYTEILLKFLGGYVSLPTGSIQIVNLAYIGVSSTVIGSLSIFIMLFCTFLDKSEHDAFKGACIVKPVGVLTCFAQLVLVATSLYVSFTPVGLETINGCQWRYIIPVLVPFLYFIGSGKIRNSIDKRIMSGAVFGTLGLCFFATIYDTVITRIL